MLPSPQARTCSRVLGIQLMRMCQLYMRASDALLRALQGPPPLPLINTDHTRLAVASTWIHSIAMATLNMLPCPSKGKPL